MGYGYCLCVLCSLAWAVTRVVNTYGPQTRGGGGQGGAEEQQRGLGARDCGNVAVQERLQNIEAHLKLPTGEKDIEVFNSYHSEISLSHLDVILFHTITDSLILLVLSFK